MRIDAHHHLWDLEKVNYPWLMEFGKERFFGNPKPIQRNFLIDEFRAAAENNDFEGSVHIQVGAADGLEEARWVQFVADSNPAWHLAQVAFCDLTTSESQEVLRQYSKLSTVVGIRQILGRSEAEDRITGTNSLLVDDKFFKGLESIAGMGYSFDLQLTPSLMASTANLLSRLPELTVVLCHAGSPPTNHGDGFKLWKDGIDQLASLPNIRCKISGLPMFFRTKGAAEYQPIIDVCLKSFGPERCMFGSNFPVDSLYKDYGELLQAYESCIPKKFHFKVFGEVAKSTYFNLIGNID